VGEEDGLPAEVTLGEEDLAELGGEQQLEVRPVEAK
jgi:hypothetical protein